LSHNGKRLDVGFYKESLRKLLECPTFGEFELLFKSESTIWDAAFVNYFSSEIQPNIHALGRWIIEPLNFYCPYSGLTTNTSEGFNNLFKSLNGNKELPLDVSIYGFNKLSVYYDNEIKRGFCNRG
jgi:hypothetical protein